MSEPVDRVLDALTRIDGVRAAVVIDADAGVPVVSDVTPGVEGAALSALAGALFTRSSAASRSTGFGRLGLLQLEAEGGHLLVAEAEPLLVAVLTEREARVGMVRIQVARAAEELKQ